MVRSWSLHYTKSNSLVGSSPGFLKCSVQVSQQDLHEGVARASGHTSRGVSDQGRVYGLGVRGLGCGISGFRAQCRVLLFGRQGFVARFWGFRVLGLTFRGLSSLRMVVDFEACCHYC